MSPLVPTDWLTCAPDSPSYHRSDYVAGRVQFTLYFLHPSNMQLYTACAVHPLQEYIYQHMCYSEHLACHISLSFPGPSSLLWFSANEPGSLRPVRRWGGLEGPGECTPQDLCHITDWRSAVWSGRRRGESQVRLRDGSAVVRYVLTNCIYYRPFELWWTHLHVVIQLENRCRVHVQVTKYWNRTHKKIFGNRQTPAVQQ